MNQPVTDRKKPGWMSTEMPETSRWIVEQRKAHGSAYVDTCIRAAMKGERNQFYAVEGGHVLGTPFDWTDRGLFVVSMSVLTGGKFIAAFRDPGGAVRLSATISEEAT